MQIDYSKVRDSEEVQEALQSGISEEQLKDYLAKVSALEFEPINGNDEHEEMLFVISFKTLLSTVVQYPESCELALDFAKTDHQLRLLLEWTNDLNVSAKQLRYAIDHDLTFAEIEHFSALLANCGCSTEEAYTLAKTYTGGEKQELAADLIYSGIPLEQVVAEFPDSTTVKELEAKSDELRDNRPSAEYIAKRYGVEGQEEVVKFCQENMYLEETLVQGAVELTKRGIPLEKVLERTPPKFMEPGSFPYMTVINMLLAGEEYELPWEKEAKMQSISFF